MRAVAIPMLGPPVPAPGYSVPQRRYDRTFDYGYVTTISPVPPPGANLLPVYWDGLALNTGDQDSGLFAIIESVDGWLASPPLDGHDTARGLADGSAWGPKVLSARVITLTGSVVGADDVIGAFRDQLVMRASNRQPADLTITDASGRALTASCRADTGQLQHTFIGLGAFRYQVALTAADPLLYDPEWQQVILSPASGVVTGRTYQRTYGWQYAASSIGNAAQLDNGGNADAVVYALFTGDLASPELSDDAGSQISLSDLAAGMTLLVESDTLSAVGPGGISRASYVQPGSVPMVIPAQSSVQWHLYASGGGYVTLQWRSAWA